MNISDQDIMEKMQQNPNVGMKLLMDAYQERLYWHIRRLVVSHDDAQDLLQETFLKVYRSWDSFKGNSSLFSWLYRIATNVVLSSLRSKHPEGTQLDEVRGWLPIATSSSAMRRLWLCSEPSIPCHPSSKRCSTCATTTR